LDFDFYISHFYYAGYLFISSLPSAAPFKKFSVFDIGSNIPYFDDKK